MANSTLTAVGLFGSATATSYVFLHNLGMSQYGLIPYLEGKVANVKLSASDKVKTWQSYYNAAMKYTLSAAFVNVVCSSLVAFTHPAPVIRRLAVGSAVMSITMVPYTLAFIMPTNHQLMALNVKAEKSEDIDGAKVDELIKAWVGLHNVRYISYIGAWLCSMAAIALTGDVFVEVVNVFYDVRPVPVVI